MREFLSVGSFFDMWSPVLLLLVIVVGYLYARSVGLWAHKFQGAEAVSGKQKFAFYTGLALFYLGQGSPIDYIGHHYLFSFHMLQQTLLYLIAPIFIWVGTPAWLLRPMIQGRVIKGLLHFFTRPLIAIFMFNMLFSIYHMPLVMDEVMSNEWFAFVYHFVLLIAAFIMWFPVFGPIPELNRLSELKKIAYMFGNGVLLTPACALIIFADTLIYEMYRDVVVPFPYLSPLDDQQLGGVLMKVLQEVIYGTVLAYIFSRWYRRERKEEEEEYPDGLDIKEALQTPPTNWNRA
jgi:putative membrane protein